MSESIVKSFRISNAQYEGANEIFKKEGFSFAEVIRLMCDATIREGRIPRGLSTKELETKLDKSQKREKYIDSILGLAGIMPKRKSSAEERLLTALFNKNGNSADMSNHEIREWAKRWGFPDGFSISTLAELHDSGLFPENPWGGDYNAEINPVNPRSGEPDKALQDALILMEMQNNLTANLEQIRKTLHVNAVNYLMEMNNAEDKEEMENDEN